MMSKAAYEQKRKFSAQIRVRFNTTTTRIELADATAFGGPTGTYRMRVDRRWCDAADVAEGKYIPRDMVEQELAARAVTLNSGLKSAVEAQALDLIETVDGNPKQAHRFLAKMEAVIDGLSNKYAQPMEIEVNLDDPSLNPEQEES